MDTDLNLKSTLQPIQDHLCPLLDAYEQMLYHYLFRNTYLIGSKECVVGLKSLRHKVGLGTGIPGRPPSEDQVRVKIRSLEGKGAIKLLERSRQGTRIRVFLPKEIENCVPPELPEKKVDIENIDFSKPPFRKAIVSRENQMCFYCFRTLKEGKYEIDHIIPSAQGGNSSYRNLVAACLECNNAKGDMEVEDFLRSLYRKNLLSAEEMQDRIKSVAEIQQGSWIPPVTDEWGDSG